MRGDPGPVCWREGPRAPVCGAGRLQEQGGATSPLCKAACAPSAVGNKELAGALMDEAGEGVAWMPKLFSFHGGPRGALGQGQASLAPAGWAGPPEPQPQPGPLALSSILHLSSSNRGDGGCGGRGELGSPAPGVLVGLPHHLCILSAWFLGFECQGARGFDRTDSACILKEENLWSAV